MENELRIRISISINVHNVRVVFKLFEIFSLDFSFPDQLLPANIADEEEGDDDHDNRCFLCDSNFTDIDL